MEVGADFQGQFVGDLPLVKLGLVKVNSPLVVLVVQVAFVYQHNEVSLPQPARHVTTGKWLQENGRLERA